MSLFDWFTSKKPAKTGPTVENTRLGHVAAVNPHAPADKLRTNPAQPSVGQAANGKTERLERRELIYSVVRDAMIRAGVLAASYRFKVLSLDAHGLQYLIMVDLANHSVIHNERLTEIEAQMTQVARMRHNLTVTAVYWRVNEQMTADPSQSPSVRVPAPTLKASELQSHHSSATSPIKQAPAYEPLQDDEVAAFKRALASVTPVAPRSAPGRIVTSGRRNPTPPTDFEDTQRVTTDDRASPLSGTQYGDLS